MIGIGDHNEWIRKMIWGVSCFDSRFSACWTPDQIKKHLHYYQ